MEFKIVREKEIDALVAHRNYNRTEVLNMPVYLRRWIIKNAYEERMEHEAEMKAANDDSKSKGKFSR